MTQKPSRNELDLIKAPNEKIAFISFMKRELHLQSNCSIIDLDNHINIQTFPKADYAVWLNWHLIVDLLWTADEESSGLKRAQDGLWIASCRYENLIFSADGSQPPLDQWCHGNKSRTLGMFFKESTCYSNIISVWNYRGRVVYWGSEPSEHWDSINDINPRTARLERHPVY